CPSPRCTPAREDQQRLVLGLPAEARDRAVVAVVVGLTGYGAAGNTVVRAPAYPEIPLQPRVGGLVGEDGRVGNLLDQPRAEDRRRDAEDHVAVRKLQLEVRL